MEGQDPVYRSGMINLKGQLLPVVNYRGPLACAECGGPANMPSKGVARQVQIGNRGWRVCVTCDRERQGWASRGVNPLAALVREVYEPVSAMMIAQRGPMPYAVLVPYSTTGNASPTDEPGRRWRHVPRVVLEAEVDAALSAVWSPR